MKYAENTFRRQFLLSHSATEQLQNWDHERLGSFNLYTHPDCKMTHVSTDKGSVVLLGHVLDPKYPDRSISDIARRIGDCPDEQGIAKELYGLVGRFVLIIEEKDRLLLFNDACGLKSFFYTHEQGRLHMASQPLLLKLVTEGVIVEGERYKEYFNSDFVKGFNEHWFPGGTSLYEGVHQLVPNHYLDSGNMKQVRYWPVEPLEIKDYESSLHKFANLLRATMEAGSRKYDLALGVTAGWDSRIILSACKSVKENMMFYTLQYRHLTEASRDIRIPMRLRKTLGINHQVMDCRIPMDKDFGDVYRGNSDMAHVDDWGHIAYGISQNLPKGKMAIKGSCSETGRCYFYKSGKHPELSSSDPLVLYNNGWKGIQFIENRLADWYDDANSVYINLGYNLLDLFHWELCTGSWQTQNQLEWDMVHDTFTPFNNRELLDLMLQIEPKYRCYPDYILYRDTMKILWPEVLSEPINPVSKKEYLKITIKSLLARLGFERYNH